jgi:hypothetical protein
MIKTMKGVAQTVLNPDRYIFPAALACLITQVAIGREPGADATTPAQPDPVAETAGTPWTGAPGITETVEQIMARQAQTPERSVQSSPVRPRTRLLRDRPPQADPLALEVSQWPAPPAPVVEESTRRPHLPQTVATSFMGAQYSDTVGYVPPDSMGAVGPSQVVVAVNGRIRVFNKNGTMGGLNVDTDVFFASVKSASTSDPHVRYDRLTQRWFVTMIDVATVNRVLIAVSSGPVINNTASFTFFQFQHDQVAPTPNSDTGGFADYDTLGVDRFALYIGANIFNASNAFLGTTGFVVNKSNLLSGTLTVTAFRQLAPASGPGPYTPQGVDNDDPAATEGYFIGVDNAYYSRLDIRRVTNPGGTPSISGNIVLGVPTTVDPITQVTKSGATGLDAVDDRLFAAAIRKNKITGVSSLWTAHNIEVNASGVGTVGGGRNGSRWYEIRNLTTTPTLNQSGTLFDSAASNPRGFWIPSVIASGQGHMALGCSYASVNDFAGVATAGRLRTDAAGSTQAPTLVLPGAAAYNFNDGSPHRWGDYSATCVDPNDDMTFWTFQEYCNAANSWAVRAVQLKAAPPATPTNASPASLTQGQTTNVVVTATSIAGSEFFDPGADTGGPGYSNHLAVAVSGGDVTVNSVTFSNPTNLTINVSVPANATPGPRSITVTNPDGQSTTSASGILTVTSNFAILQPVCSGTNFLFSFNSSTGVTYQVLYKNSLTDPTWLTNQTVLGDGTTLTITNSLSDSPQRFFRLMH